MRMLFPLLSEFPGTCPAVEAHTAGVVGSCLGASTSSLLFGGCMLLPSALQLLCSCCLCLWALQPTPSQSCPPLPLLTLPHLPPTLVPAAPGRGADRAQVPA